MCRSNRNNIDIRALLLLPVLFGGNPATAQDDVEGWQGIAVEQSPEPLAGLSDDWLVGGFDTSSRWITAGVALGLGAYLATADTDAVRDLGDITQLLPGVFALTSNLVIGDREGLKQFAYAGATTLLATMA